MTTMATTTPSKGRRLTRADLKSFDQTATNLILDAMERGGTGIVSNRGHAILYAPGGGGTISVSRKLSSNNRARQNSEAEFARVFGGLSPIEETRSAPAPVSTALAPALSLADSPTLECPLDDCDAVFVTQGALYSHSYKIHHVCPEPGCQFVAKTSTGAQGHYRIVHLGQKPALGNRGGGRTTAKAVETLQTIRDLLGVGDPAELDQLRKDLAVMTKRAEAAEKKLAKLKEALA